MSQVQVIETNDSRWGACLAISNGTIEMLVSVAFGPRIMRFHLAGEPNMFFEDVEGAIGQSGDQFAPVGGGEWKIYGGHRLWTSPESVPRTTYPDNEPVEWRTTDRGVVLTAPEERWNQLRKEIEIEVTGDNEVRLTHRITNTGPWAVQFAPWALSVMAAGGTAIVPQVRRETNLLPNRVLAVWPYSKMNDPRVTWGDKFIVLRQDTERPKFKFGTNNEAGWAAYYNYNTLFVKKYDHVYGGTYPDYGVSFETYTDERILELETLGELQSVAPQATVTHIETLSLHKNVELQFADEDVLEQALAKYAL